MQTFLKIIITSIILLTSTQAFADNKLNLEIAYQVLHIVDWGTTRNLVNRESEGYCEMNPLIGRHPNMSRVDAFMFTSGILHAVTSYSLPESAFNGRINPRKLWQYVTFGVKVGAVTNNISIGLRIDF